MNSVLNSACTYHVRQNCVPGTGDRVKRQIFTGLNFKVGGVKYSSATQQGPFADQIFSPIHKFNF
jgi:hypothetical protein